MIPQFPEFKPITLDDKATLDDYLRRNPPQASEYTFTNLFAWRDIYQYRIAAYHGGFLIRKGREGQFAFLQPLVPDDPIGAVQDCFRYLVDTGNAPFVDRVGEDFLARANWVELGMLVGEDRDDFDYLYETTELLELKGKKFHDKKNLLNQFTSRYEYQYFPLTEAMTRLCLDVQHEWCVVKNCERYEELTHENCAVVQMLTHFTTLSMSGGALFIGDEIVAFTLGEWLNTDTLVIHVEKARNGLPGVYQAINWEFLRHQANGYTFVNREQDLGEEGLRKAKLSYNPVRMVKKYEMRIA